MFWARTTDKSGRTRKEAFALTRERAAEQVLMLDPKKNVASTSIAIADGQGGWRDSHRDIRWINRRDLPMRMNENPHKRDFRGRFKKKRYASPVEARAIFDRMYARGEAEHEAHLRTPAGEAERQEFNRRTLERLRMRKNPRDTGTKFRNLSIGDTFDFVGPGRFNSFYDRCEKTGSRTYTPIEGNLKGHKLSVGSINADVFHVTRKMRKNPRNDTAVELALFIENDGQIYRSQTLPIIKNLQRKIAKGTYDPQKALKLWRHLADRGAHDYFKQHGEPHTTTWFQMFSTKDRADAAKLLAEKYEEHVREPLPMKKRKRHIGPRLSKEQIRLRRERKWLRDRDALPPDLKIVRKHNPVVGKFFIRGDAEHDGPWFFRHSTQSFTDTKQKATAYRSRAHAERVAKTLVSRLPVSIERITVTAS